MRHAPAPSAMAWEPKEWEQYVKSLLRLRHPNADFQDTPSEYRGDAGLDGFAIRMRRAYQAYAPTEPLTDAERHERHREKITNDTNKLRRRRQDVQRILGDVILSRWTLVVPTFTSTLLVGHASDKSQEVRGWGLPFIADDFRIMIECLDDFVIERNMLHGTSGIFLPLEEPDVSDDEAEHFSTETPDFMANLARKLAIVRNGQQVPVDRLHRMIVNYLKSQNLETQLQEYATAYEEYATVKRRREALLDSVSQTAVQSSGSLLKDVRAAFADDLSAAVPSTRPVDRDMLVEGSMIGWLGICNLEPEEPGDASGS
ncbi:MAG: hypothetical protein AAGG07_05685 [Planctomycetota bacterium]